MESNVSRLSSILSELNTNIQDDVIRRTSSFSSTNSAKNSSSFSENKKDVSSSVNDQENKPSGIDSTTSAMEDVVFKKPVPRAIMANEERALNSVIDELNHLKLGSTPIKSKRFNFFKWTTPLKRKSPQSDDSCELSECFLFDENSHSPLHNEKPADDSSSSKSDIETDTNQNKDPDVGSDYYDCGEEEPIANEQALIDEVSSDSSNSADSSFHSVSEKQHVDKAASGYSSIVKSNSKLVCEANIAELNSVQDNDQAFILEKYLTEQDFKLEISLSEMSFNSAINNIDLDSKRESISIQTENTISGSLFSFEQEEKSQLCLNEPQKLKEITIQADQSGKVCAFADMNERQTEDSLFNLITDYMIQNETQTSFDLKSEENMFTLSRISEAAFLHINTIEEENALLQKPARISLQPQSDNVNSNQNNANQSETPVSEKTEVNAETVDENNEPDVETSINEISSNLSRISISAQHSNVDQFSTNMSVTDYTGDDAKKAADKSDLCPAETNETISVESTENLNENDAESKKFSPVTELNETVGSEFQKLTITADFETVERNFDHVEVSTFNQTVNLEVSQRFSFEIEDERLCNKNSNETVHLEKTETFDDSVMLKSNETVNLEASQHFSLEIEEEYVCENSNKTVDLEEKRAFNDEPTSESNRTVVLEASQHFYSEIESESLSYENSNKTVSLEENRTLNEGNTSNANQTIDLEISQNFSLEIKNENSNKTVNLEKTRTFNGSDTLELTQAVHLGSAKTIYIEVEVDTSKEICPNTSILNQTSSSEASELFNEKINGRSSHRKISVESATLEFSPEIVEKITEPCQMSNANQTFDLGISEVTDEHKSIIDDLKEQPVNLETTSIIDETPAEPESPVSNRTIAYDLEITRVIGDENLTDQNAAFLQTRESNCLKSPRPVEKQIDTIIESDDSNRTFHINVDEQSHDSSMPVQPSLRKTEAADLEDFCVMDKKISNISESRGESINSEVETIKNEESAEIQQDLDEQNKTVYLDDPATIENEPVSLQESSKLNETITMYENTTQTVAHSCESVDSEYDTDVQMEIEKIAPCCHEIVTEICLEYADAKYNGIPTSNTEGNFKNSADDCSMSAIITTTEKSVLKEPENLNVSSTKQFDDTVMIRGSPCPRRSDSPCQFDVHAIPSNETASPIPPNSPTELNCKWQTQVDLTNVVDHLECITGRDSPSNYSDELDITDPVDSNLAPEMLPIGKLPPGMNRSSSNLESIPEMNEVEDPNLSKENVNQDTKDQKLLETGTENAESKSEVVLNRTTISIVSGEQQGYDVSCSTQIESSSEIELKSKIGHDKSIIVGGSLNTADMIFKTPIGKLFQQSDLSALNDCSSFNADYCCTLTASAKASQSFRQSLVSPKHSFFKGSTPIFSSFCTPNRRMRQATPEASGDIPPSLLDLSIGYFVKCSATQVEPNELPETDVNKTIDADEEQQRHEETKLLYLDEPSRKVNVKTQTHDTELSDLRAENAKLRQDLNALSELSQAIIDNEVELKKTIQAIAHNEAELKETVRVLEDNNRILNNKYELLNEYANELLVRRNKELDEAEEKIQALQIELNKYSKEPKSAASSK